MGVDVRVETTIDLPVSVVAAYAGDPGNAPSGTPTSGRSTGGRHPRWRSGRWMALVARFLGRGLACTCEVVELVPERQLVMRTADGPFPMETTYAWAPVGASSTVMALRNRGNPSGFARLTAPMMERAMRRATTKDLARLKSLLEADGERG